MPQVTLPVGYQQVTFVYDISCVGRINQTFDRRGRLVPLLEEAPGAPDGK